MSNKIEPITPNEIVALMQERGLTIEKVIDASINYNGMNQEAINVVKNHIISYLDKKISKTS